MIHLKNADEIMKIRRASRINAAVHDKVSHLLRRGVTTRELNETAEAEMTRLGGRPSFQEEFNYPGVICVSVNDEIGHGIPGERVLRGGDVVKVDIGVEVDGFHSDCARTYLIDEGVDEDARSQDGRYASHSLSTRHRKKHLIDSTEEALNQGLACIEPGRRLSDVSHAIGLYVANAGLSIVKKAHGHGVGQSLHEDPQIPNYGPGGMGPRLRTGMVLAIEPVVVDGSPMTRLREDGWTEMTVDGSLGAHFEHTVLVTSNGAEILTASHHTKSGEIKLEKKGLTWRQKTDQDNHEILRLAQKEMDPILLEAWGRPVHPMEILSAPASATYVLVDRQERVRGFYIFSYQTPYLHLNTLVLDASLHGTGVAPIVMDLISDQAYQAGMVGINLWVQVNNKRAIRFYEKLGFVHTGTPYFRTWSMRRNL